MASGQPLDALEVLCIVSHLVTAPLEAALQHKKDAVQSALLPPVHTDTPWTSSDEVCTILYYLPSVLIARILSYTY
jgi:hypothetical protein